MTSARNLLILAVVVVLASPALAQRRAPPRACPAELGARAARDLVRDCREANLAAPALCRPETPCEAMREMIAEGCRAPGTEDKPVCRNLDSEDDEDEDDE